MLVLIAADRRQVERLIKKLGLMGGTFDPIHHGHLVTAEAVREEFGLDKVLFVPAAQPPHKLEREVAPAYARLLMTEMAVCENTNFEVSKIELERTGPSYSVQTLRELNEYYGHTAEFYFILGADAINELGTWHKPEELLHLCHFIAATRQGSLLDMERLRRELGVQLVGERIHELSTPELQISSTDIRNKLQAGLSIKYLVPSAVEAYIYKEGLYQCNAR